MEYIAYFTGYLLKSFRHFLSTCLKCLTQFAFGASKSVFTLKLTDGKDSSQTNFCNTIRSGPALRIKQMFSLKTDYKPCKNRRHSEIARGSSKTRVQCCERSGSREGTRDATASNEFIIIRVQCQIAKKRIKFYTSRSAMIHGGWGGSEIIKRYVYSATRKRPNKRLMGKRQIKQFHFAKQWQCAGAKLISIPP